jgi:hypothetical protein
MSERYKANKVVDSTAPKNNFMYPSTLVLSSLNYLTLMQTFCYIIFHCVSCTDVDIAKQSEAEGQAPP